MAAGPRVGCNSIGPVFTGPIDGVCRRGRAALTGRGRKRVTESAATAVGSPRTGVLIAHPDMLVRAGLRSVIDGDGTFDVVAEVEAGEHALELAGRLRPSLAILGTVLRDPSGIEVAREMRGRSPGTAVILLARRADTQSLLDGFRAGAIGFIRSDIGRLELLSSMRRTLAGEFVVDAVAATELIVRLASESDSRAQHAPEPLTPRELEVLRLVAQGRTNREIAQGLIVAVGTIKVHMEHILDKLGATDRTQAAVRAVELGIVSVEEPGAPRLGASDPGM